MTELRAALVEFRDSTVHSKQSTRSWIESALVQGQGTEVDNRAFYRVCTAGDVCLSYAEYSNTHHFVSCCGSLAAANAIKRYPPNPFANKIARV